MLQGLTPLLNEQPVKSAMLQRTSFGNRHSRSSQSYDDLEDHYAALNINSRHGYAKIRPRNRPNPPLEQSLGSNVSASQDMWAYKMDDSIVSPKYLFDHPVYASHSQLDTNPYLLRNLTTRSNGTGIKGKKSTSHKIGPKTMNPKFVNPYSKVPIKISDSFNCSSDLRHESSEAEPGFYPAARNLFLPPEQIVTSVNLNNSQFGMTDNSSPNQESFSVSHSMSHSSSSGTGDRSSGELQDEQEPGYSHDYVDLPSDSQEDDHEPGDEQYRDMQLQGQSVFGARN